MTKNKYEQQFALVRLNLFVSSPVGALAVFLLILNGLRINHASDNARETIKNVYLPTTMRSEGRVILSYSPHDTNKTIQHHYAFSESIDEVTQQSRVSIGFISYSPKDYISRREATLARLDENGNCIKNENTKTFVPELDGFARLIYDDSELASFFDKNPYSNGPTGIIQLFIHLNPNLKIRYDGITSYRNIDCSMYNANFKLQRSDDSFAIVYVPTETYFNTTRAPMFGFVQRIRNLKGKGVDQSSLTYDVTITIDYFNIQALDDNQAQSHKMVADFNLPLARGCSEIVQTFYVDYWNSFIMNFFQQSTGTQVSIAYDHEWNYLRKEMFEETISVWDLKDEILYHIDPHSKSQIVLDNNNRTFDTSQCSMLNVSNSDLGASFRPYDEYEASLTSKDFLGIGHIAYIGQSEVRDFPTRVYETVTKQAPKLFGLELASHQDNVDFITQFHSLDHDTGKKTDIWPLRFSLFKRNKSAHTIDLIDQLEVSDFHWGLMGWEKKPAELFMVSECFDDEYEQVRLELAIDFHLRDDIDRKLLANNKYKLEVDLIDQIFEALDIRRIHLLEYELTLRPHNIILNMIIGDRREIKALIKFPEDKIPVLDKAYDKNTIVLDGLVEQDCVSRVSLIRDAKFLVYCPFTQTEQSSCKVYTQDVGFSTTHKRDGHSPYEQCQFYRLNPEQPPPPATGNWLDWRDKLRNRELSFQVEAQHGNRVSFQGSIQDLDISREKKLEIVVNYKFAIDKDVASSSLKPLDSFTRNVRYFESMTYKSVGDCAKMCNLDTHCKSYSYCSSSSSSQAAGNGKRHQPGDSCILSSLDIRASEVNLQLSRASMSDWLPIRDITNDVYNLTMSTSCNIYERDYLNMFTPTDEVIQLDESLIRQLRDEESTFDCAKAAVDLEASHPDHHVAMFAFCAYSNTCLLDENLFMPTNSSSEVGGGGNGDGGGDGDGDGDTTNINGSEKFHELPCNVYRRRYQSYFKVSAHILKPQPANQVQLHFNSVEECARACWNQFGHVCGSFDYCWPSSCTINQVTSSADLSISRDDLEIRSDCLHYDRDLELDKLRVDYLIGRHRVLETKQPGQGWTLAGLLVNVLIFCMISVAFVAGLVAGRLVNDRLESLTIVRLSFSAGSNGLRRVSRAFSGAWANRFGASGGGGASSGGDYDGTTSVIGQQGKVSLGSGGQNVGGMESFGSRDYSSAIQLEEIKKNVIKEDEEQEEEEEKEAEAKGTSMAGSWGEQNPGRSSNSGPNNVESQSTNANGIGPDLFQF